MRRMKICFWGDVFSAFQGNPKGGAEKQISCLASALSEMGHEIIVADTGIMEDHVVNRNFVFLSMRREWLKPFPLRIWSLYYFFGKIGANIYYSRMPSIWHIFPYAASRRNKALFILGMAHDLDTLSFSDRFQVFYSKNNLQKLLKHLFHTELTFNYLLKKADIVFAQHGGQVRNLKRRGIEALHCPNIAFVPEADPINPPFGEYFLFVGRLNHQKGLKEILEIIGALKGINFVVIGRPASNHAAGRILDLRELPNCFYLDQVPNKTVIGWMKRAEALISTSTMEGFPNTFLESWSVGTPVISLFSNPDNQFRHHFLGEFCNGDLSKLISMLDNFESANFENKRMKAYVRRHNSAASAGQAFVSGLEYKQRRQELSEPTFTSNRS